MQVVGNIASLLFNPTQGSFSGVPSFGRAYTPQEASLAKKVIPQALSALGKENFLINIHAYSLPRSPQSKESDIATGSPYSAGSKDFFSFAATEGFNGQVFQPQGFVSKSDPNPYRGKLFSRNVLEIDFTQLAGETFDGILPEKELQAIIR